MKKIGLLLLMIAIAVSALVLPAAGCTGEAQTVTVTTTTTTTEILKSTTIIDDLGREVTVTGTPSRIVSLAPSNTEILFDLGLGDKVYGVTELCNYPEEALAKEKVCLVV